MFLHIPACVPACCPFVGASLRRRPLLRLRSPDLRQLCTQNRFALGATLRFELVPTLFLRCRLRWRRTSTACAVACAGTRVRARARALCCCRFLRRRACAPTAGCAPLPCSLRRARTYCSVRRAVKCCVRGSESNNMLGGASQIVRRIRTKCQR